jgi:hypothetical protein
MKSGYYQIWIIYEDVEKTMMWIKYGLYEFLVMFFGLCNILATFKTLMNLILYEKLDKFVINYIDDIFIYSKTATKHVMHLEYVLRKLKENQFFANHVKSEFAQEEINFLRHVRSHIGVNLNTRKLEAIKC